MKVFLDTSALFALLDKRDLSHAEAASLFGPLLEAGELVTHNYIHIEAEQLVRRRLGAGAAADLAYRLLPSIETIWIDQATHQAALDARAAGSAGPSLVDHVSFVVMRSIGTEVALAFDRDFDTAGFTRPTVNVHPHRLSESAAPYGSNTDAQDLVSVTEISRRSGRAISTVQSWRRRHSDFPAPNVELAAGPIWLWGDVSSWIQQRDGSRRPG